MIADLDGEEHYAMKLAVIILMIVILMVTFLFYIGRCEFNTTHRWCACNPGWGGSTCMDQSCKGITKCNLHGFYIFI